jgi:hypothetical protein
VSRLNQSGQTLIALLIFMLVSVTITIAAIAVSIINLTTTTGYISGQQALNAANSGAENGLLELERNRNYSGGTMTLDGGTATISVSYSDNFVIVSVGQVGNFKRTVTVDLNDNSSAFTVTSWNETP